MVSGWKQCRHVWIQLLVFASLWIPTAALSFANSGEFQHSNQMHSAVPITFNALLNFAYGYSSTTFYHLVHTDASKGDENNEKKELKIDDPHIASRVLGSWNQLGAMLGSLIAYGLVEKGVIS
jgi:hypothetical protein